jgi:hypothetical protein
MGEQGWGGGGRGASFLPADGSPLHKVLSFLELRINTKRKGKTSEQVIERKTG